VVSTSERRSLLRRIAIRSCDANFNDGLDDQIAAMATYWAGFDRQEPDLPGTRRELDDLADDMSKIDADALVVLVAGHGVSDGSGTHYLLLPGSDPHDLGRTAYDTGTLVKASVAAAAAHILTVVNTCYAGALDEAVDRFRKDLPLPPTVGLLVTADHDQRPRVFDLARLLQGVDHRLRTTAQHSGPYLSFNEFLRQLTEVAKEAAMPIPRLLLPATERDRASPCLPNPGYTPPAHLVGPALRQVAITESDLDFWQDKASGRPTADDTGWYFRGRESLMRDVTSHLNRGSGVLVVTGTQSSGKSAILARAVTLTDPAFLDNPHYAHVLAGVPYDLKPRAGSVAAAGRARNIAVRLARSGTIHSPVVKPISAITPTSVATPRT